MTTDVFRTLYKSIQQEDNSHNIPNVGISYLKEENEKVQIAKNQNNKENFTVCRQFMENNIKCIIFRTVSKLPERNNK